MGIKQSIAKRLEVDPAYGAGLVILGILVMGISGAATWHYVFNAGTGIALLGALLFVAGVTAHALSQGSADSGAGSDAPADRSSAA